MLFSNLTKKKNVNMNTVIIDNGITKRIEFSPIIVKAIEDTNNKSWKKLTLEQIVKIKYISRDLGNVLETSLNDKHVTDFRRKKENVRVETIESKGIRVGSEITGKVIRRISAKSPEWEGMKKGKNGLYNWTEIIEADEYNGDKFIEDRRKKAPTVCLLTAEKVPTV